MKKIFSVGLLTFALMGSGCASKLDTVTNPEITGVQYTDEKTGISFLEPDGWRVGTDESENLYTYGEDPYQTVTFKVYSDQNTWEAEKNNPSNPSNLKIAPDILVGSGTKEIDGSSVWYEIYERRYSQNGATVLSYQRYFFDGGNSWYIVETSEPTAVVDAIVSSIHLPTK